MYELTRYRPLDAANISVPIGDDEPKPVTPRNETHSKRDSIVLGRFWMSNFALSRFDDFAQLVYQSEGGTQRSLNGRGHFGFHSELEVTS